MRSSSHHVATVEVVAEILVVVVLVVAAVAAVSAAIVDAVANVVALVVATLELEDHVACVAAAFVLLVGLTRIAVQLEQLTRSTPLWYTSSDRRRCGVAGTKTALDDLRRYSRSRGAIGSKRRRTDRLTERASGVAGVAAEGTPQVLESPGVPSSERESVRERESGRDVRRSEVCACVMWRAASE